METLKFETGNVYQMTFIGDNDLRTEFICVKRTSKTVTFERFKGYPYTYQQGARSRAMTRRIKVYDNCEYILDGNYSMAPSIKASRIVA